MICFYTVIILSSWAGRGAGWWGRVVKISVPPMVRCGDVAVPPHVASVAVGMERVIGVTAPPSVILRRVTAG